jgi:hypothetical protein
MDIARSLLDAIQLRLKEKTLRGESLDVIGSFFVLRTANTIPPDFGTLTPLVLVRLGAVTAEQTSIPPCMVNKIYPVIFSVFTEDNGDNEDDSAAEILDLIESEFYGETFDLSQWVDVISKDYTQATFPPFGQWNGSGEIIFNHYDTDMREVT